ncbi:MAG: hypothetical protein K2K96_12695 [Lachnospiraceae bacterium]|nr:hypothetical protein [Lachnospiraceae bacterium]
MELNSGNLILGDEKIRMRNYLWKNLIVFVCIISTLLLQGFSCYAAASGADTSSVSTESTIVEIDNVDIDSVDIENVIMKTESTDTGNAISETQSTETEDVFMEIETENVDTEEAVVETENHDTEEAVVDTENSDTEDAVAEVESAKAEDSEAESDSVIRRNTVSPVVTEEEIVAIDQPAISEYGVQPFDYIIDPQRLITATNGVKYGNISFEEGSTLYFRNTEGRYDYSSRSDQLTITSQSTVPVMITLTASLQNHDTISLTNDPTFKGDNRNSLYLALVDDKGNVVPLSESGEVKIIYEMGQISMDEAIEGAGEEQYSFGLTGACNPNGSWEYLAELPQIVVTWKVDPIVNNEDTVSDNSISDNSISMNSVSDNSISMNGVSDNSISMNSVSDNSISMNGVSDNSISMNGVSDNSISMNSVSDNSVSMNDVSDNSILMNGESDNNVSENGEVLPSEVQNVENNYIEETGEDHHESADDLGNVISENNVTDNHGETEDSVLTDNDDATDIETETAQTEDGSSADVAETIDSAGSNVSGDDAGTTGSSMSSQAPAETVSELSDSSTSVQTGITIVEVEAGAYY